MKRREFLARGSSLTLVLAGGGLSVAYAGSGKTSALASADAVLSIDDTGKVMFTSPYTEMGQGSPTAASMIVADELDTDLDGVVVKFHDGRIVQTDPTFGSRFNGGGSGGSQSMPTAWPALREIGAACRTMLIETAAAAWAVSAAECDTAVDKVVHKPSGRSVPYGRLVAAAADRPVPEKPRFRDVSDYRYVGKDRVRGDMDQIVTGRAPYAMDHHQEGMLFASIERCPTIDGSPAQFDKAAALSVAGVVDVFSINPKDVERSAKCSVVVVARDTWSALQGRRKLKASWEDNAATFADESVFWDNMQRQLDTGKPNADHTEGEFDAVALDDLKETEQLYRLGYQNQTMMEPISITAHHRGESFELWTSTQYPSDDRDRIAEVTGLEQDQIKLNNTIMGGSFGRRFVKDGLTEVIMIADKLRKPVKLVWTREDDIRNGQYRNASLMKIQAHVDDEGQIRRWYSKAVQTTPGDPSRVAHLGDGMTDTPYRLSPARFEMTGIKGNVNLGPMRSPPHPSKLFPTECFLDELAHDLGEDPIDLHLRLIGKKGRELPTAQWLANNGHENNTAAYTEVAHLVREMSDWDKSLPEGRGKGFALGYIFGTYIATVVEADWRDDALSIENVWCAVNCGRVINPDVAKQQVEGGTIYGLSSAMGEVITTAGGAVQQGNFNDYPIMRFAQAPDITVEFVKTDRRPSGLGEPATPPAYPALANAVFAASGKRIREIPLNRHIRFASTRRLS